MITFKKMILIIFLATMGTMVTNIINVNNTARAELAENVLSVNLIKYDPHPVSPDSDFDLWVKVKNIGDNDVNGISLEFVPKYPFSIKGDSKKFIDIIRKKDEFIYKFSIHIDKNALVGTSTIEIGYRIENFFTKKEFDIEIGKEVVNTKGTLELEKFTLSPEILMPGDFGIVVITMKNSASQYTIKIDDKDYSLNAQIQSAELIGNEFIEVIGDPYYDAGIIGPGDSIDLHFIVKVKNNTNDGTYLLNLNLKGSDELYKLNLKIPVKIDSKSLNVALSKIQTDNTQEIQNIQDNSEKIILNVANNRPNTVRSVSIYPVSNLSNMKFEPLEYFIGTMEPDELYTVKFDVKSNNTINDINKNVNNSMDVKFKIRFKNGDNWHESELFVAIDKYKEISNEESPILGIFTILVFLVILSYIGKRILKEKKKKGN